MRNAFVPTLVQCTIIGCEKKYFWQFLFVGWKPCTHLFCLLCLPLALLISSNQLWPRV